MAVTTTIPPGARSSSPCSAASGPPPPSRCCDSGRPLYTDPTTGHTVCSCQHEQILNYQRMAQASLIGPGGLPLPMYNSPYAEGLPAYLPGAEQSHFYPNLVSRRAPNWSRRNECACIAENPKHMSHLILFCSLLRERQKHQSQDVLHSPENRFARRTESQAFRHERRRVSTDWMLPAVL